MVDPSGVDIPWEAVRPYWRRARLVTALLFLCLGIYAVIGWMVVRESGQGPRLAPELVTLLRHAFVGLSGIQFVAAGIYRFAMLSPERVRHLRGDLPRVGERFLSASIVVGALGEAIAIYGLIFVLLSNDFRAYLPFASISILHFILFWPSRMRLRHLLDEIARDELKAL